MSLGHVTIGLLLPSTGVDSAQGTDAAKGFELYLDKLGYRAGGREIRIVKEDDEARPALALAKIRKLVEGDGVDFVVGPISSAVALAIRSYVHEHATPLLVPAAFTRVLTSPQQASPNIFRLSETSDQANYPMGTWMMKNTRYRKVIVMAADFAGGRHSVEAFMAGFRAGGGEIVAEIYPPFGTADFAPYLREAGSMKADAVYAWFAGADAVHFVKQYKQCELGQQLPLAGHSALTVDTILPSIGDAALGIVTVGAYSAALETQENREFVRDYDAAYETWPSRYSECGWIAAALIGTALDTLRGDLSDRSRVRAELKHALPKIKPPRGPMRFDAYRQAISPIYITRTEKSAERLVNTVIDRIPAVSQESTWGWWNNSRPS
ncbi:MAG: penicillin-binding protein activator [Betaproteobacteria bacterium]|nr:penicillin-binding protein activator [Betaproteobacteria bacterium]